MPYTSNDNNLICVAQIMGPHGIRGYVKIQFFGEDPNLLDQYGPLIDSTGQKAFALKRQQFHKDHWLVSIDGYKDRNDIEKLKGTKLFIERHRLPDLSDNEFYYEDLVGLKVRYQDNLHFGIVTAVHNFGASDLLEIMPKNGTSFFLPFNGENILEINVEENYIEIDPIDGIIESED